MLTVVCKIHIMAKIINLYKISKTFLRFKCDYLILCPIFAQNFYHGSEKKFKRIILDFILYFSYCSCCCHCHSLALVNPHPSICYYFLCTGHGYHLISTLPFSQ